MSKELEKLTTEQIAIELFNIVSNGEYNMNDLVYYFNRIDDALAELEELKRYPTADEVCEALMNEETIDDVEYNKKLNDFLIFQDRYGEWLGRLSFKKIKELLPPHLITLIGRFYEGLEEK